MTQENFKSPLSAFPPADRAQVQEARELNENISKLNEATEAGNRNVRNLNWILIGLTIAVVLLTAASLFLLLPREQEFGLSVREKCRELGEEAHEQVVRDAEQFTQVFNPQYSYNKELDTCLYSSGTASPDVIHQWVTDSFTNEELITVLTYAGESITCPTCLTEDEFKEKQRGLMGF